MKTYIYVASGYSLKGWGNYSIITVAECTGKPAKAWWHGKMNVLRRTGKLYVGSTVNCQFHAEMTEIKKQYLNAIII